MAYNAFGQPLLRPEARPPSSEVERLLKVARTGERRALRAAQEELQASEFGHAWFARVHERRGEISQQLPVQEILQRETLAPSGHPMAR